MQTRRQLILGSTAAVAAGLVPVPSWAEEAILTEDGLYKQPWFIESFLELGDDLETTRKAGKRFAVMWELKGCPYCKETHLVNFARPDIADYVRSNFDILQLNIIGSRKVTDFDGEELGEKQLAAKYGVRFTPTIQFFPDTAEGLKAKPAREREATRSTGYLVPDEFLAMFRYVRDNAYATQNFRDYLKARS
jgi:thioredoxin-related protein